MECGPSRIIRVGVEQREDKVTAVARSRAHQVKVALRLGAPPAMRGERALHSVQLRAGDRERRTRREPADELVG